MGNLHQRPEAAEDLPRCPFVAGPVYLCGQTHENLAIEIGELVGGSFDGLGEAIRIAESVAHPLDALKGVLLGPVGPAESVEGRLDCGDCVFVPAQKSGQMFDLSFSGAGRFDAAGSMQVFPHVVGQRQVLGHGGAQLDDPRGKSLDDPCCSLLFTATATFAPVVWILDHDADPLFLAHSDMCCVEVSNPDQI